MSKPDREYVNKALDKFGRVVLAQAYCAVTYATANYATANMELLLLTSFRSEKARLDSEARRRGQPRAGSTEVYPLLESLLRSFCVLNPGERIEMIKQINETEAGLLLGFSHHMAVQAVVQSSKERLRLGLLSLILENMRQDYRETLIRLCLLNHSANKIGVKLNQVFEDLQKCATDETNSLIISYLAKPDAQKDLSTMAYKEIQSNKGFAYKRDW